jgi:hypothetical protein
MKSGKTLGRNQPRVHVREEVAKARRVRAANLKKKNRPTKRVVVKRRYFKTDSKRKTD